MDTPEPPAPLAVECVSVRRPDPPTGPAVTALTHNLRAFASLVFGGELVVHGVRLVGNPAWPEPKVFFPCHTGFRPCPGCAAQAEERDHYCRRCGEPLPPLPPGARLTFFDHVHPLNGRLREAARRSVLALHDRMVAEGRRELRTERAAPVNEEWRREQRGEPSDT